MLTIKNIVNKLLEEDVVINTICIMSFGYDYGIPENCNLIIDIRHIDLREVDKEDTGKNKEIQDLFLARGGEELLNMLVSLIKYYLRQEFFQGICLGIGCAWGKHRSVACVELLGQVLRNLGYNIVIKHRDINEKH